MTKKKTASTWQLAEYDVTLEDDIEEQYGELVVVSIVDEEISNMHASCIAVMVPGADTRTTKEYKLKIGPESNQLTVKGPFVRSLIKDGDTIVRALADNAKAESMTKLHKTVKGIIKRLKKKAEKKEKKTIILTFSDDISFSDEYFNKGARDGYLKKLVLPIEYTKKTLDKSTNEETEYNHIEALIIWRAYVEKTAVAIDDVSEDDSDDDMEQLIQRSKRMQIA